MDNIHEIEDIVNRHLEAVKQDGMTLKYVPKDVQKAYPLIALEAVKQNGEALRWVHKDLRTSELCKEAVKQNGEALEYVHKDVQKAYPLIALEAVRQNSMALKYVAKCMAKDCYINLPLQEKMTEYILDYPLTIRGMLSESLKKGDSYIHNIGTSKDVTPLVPKLPFIIKRIQQDSTEATKIPLIKALRPQYGPGVEIIKFLGDESPKLNCLSRSLKYYYKVLYSGQDYGLTTKHIKPDYTHLNLEKYLLWDDSLDKLYYAYQDDIAGVESKYAIENN